MNEPLFWANYMATVEFHLCTNSIIELTIERKENDRGNITNYFVSGKLSPISSLS